MRITNLISSAANKTAKASGILSTIMVNVAVCAFAGYVIKRSVHSIRLIKRREASVNNLKPSSATLKSASETLDSINALLDKSIKDLEETLKAMKKDSKSKEPKKEETSK